MKNILYIIVLLLLAFPLNAQTKKEATPDKTELDNYRYQAEKLVEYFAETLNFLGDSTTISKERQIIINESYLKMFKDEDHIEDDLIEDRMVPVYKDIRGYLRDIGFFYKHVHFEYVIQDIEHFYNSRKEINFRVTVNRHLIGKTIKNELVENNMIRYIEIDLDHAHEILKIVSIYSTRLEEKEDIEIWWALLPNYWKSYFAKDIPLENGLFLSDVVAFNDSIISFPYTEEFVQKLSDSSFILVDSSYKNLNVNNFEYFAQFSNPTDSNSTIILPKRINIKYSGASLHSIIGNMMKQISVNISNQSIYSDLSPLVKMTYLKELNLSGTPINNILDLRNLNNLEVLNISNTSISDISPLQYLINIKSIDFSNTNISDISTISYNSALEEIKMNNTPVSDIFPLARLTELKKLWMNHTAIHDISALANNNKMEIISFHNTNVSNCDVLKGYPNLIMAGMNDTKMGNISNLNGLSKLQNIFINNTSVSDISKLDNMESLTRIYCDGSKISKQSAVEYMNLYPTTLVVFESAHLQKWWSSQPDNLKQLWKEMMKTNANPDNDLLHKMVIIKELDFSFRNISSIDFLSEMLMLENLNLSGNSITTLSPLSNITTLQYINVSKTKINDITPIINNTLLNTIIANETPIVNFETIIPLKKLTLIECDQSSIIDKTVDEIIHQNPICLVIYRTVKNKIWWDNLSSSWKDVFSTAINSNSTPDKYDLQRIVNLKTINISNNRSINNLDCLQPFRYLQKLIVAGTGLTTIDEVNNITSLTYLDFSNNPIENIDKLTGLINLDTLLMENTQIKKIDFVSKFSNLRHLNISGTQVKNLRPLATSHNLVSIDFNNTSVSNISPLLELNNLQQIKAYRTKISASKIEDFKLRNPSCDVIYY